MGIYHSKTIGNNMGKLKKFAKAGARIAMKASPIPIPEELTGLIGIQDDKMNNLDERLGAIERKLNRILKLLKNGNGTLDNN
mgnify:CR=1 FL=1